MRAFGRFIPGRKKETEEEKEQRIQYQMIQDLERSKAEKGELLNRVLPWNLEQQVSAYLNPLKVPLVLLVTVLGCYVEYQITKAPMKSWYAPYKRHGPTCWVHELEEDLITHDVMAISNFLNTTFWPITSGINRVILKYEHCAKGPMNITECNFFNLPPWLNFTKDHCGITPQCGIDEEMEEKEIGYYGLARRLPWVPYSVVWAVYKLVFLPFYPIDRIVNFVEGYPKPMSEPIFKLLIEPYSTKCSTVMNLFAKIGKVFRYSLLPNSIMLPLFSMSKHSRCSKYIYYEMDTLFATFIYGYVLFDLALVLVAYIIGKFVVEGCIQTCKYRVYKAYWFISLWTSIILFIVDLLWVFDIRFWEGLFSWLDMTFVFDPNLNFAIDIVKKLLGFNAMLDYMQLVILILGIVLPLLPCLKQKEGSSPFSSDLSPVAPAPEANI